MTDRQDGAILRAEEKKINWYPGHMAKARRLLSDQLSRVDVVIELCDARIPRASRNPDLNMLVQNKPRLLVLNKSDLAQEGATRAWLTHLRAQGVTAIAFDSVRGRQKDVLSRVERLSAEVVAKMAAKGVRKVVRVMVVGVPNVGKSTFTNKLFGSAIARTGDRPGVTKSNQWVRVTPYLEILDTPGLLWPKLDDQQDARALAYVGTVSDKILDEQMLAIRLTEELLLRVPQAVIARFRLKPGEEALRGEALLEAICRDRGWLLPGGVCDTDRGASVMLDEFRAGKLGRITLQLPPTEEART